MYKWNRSITFSKPTVRLALTYLCIIVIVSLAYSAVMYRITARQLVLQFHDVGGSQELITRDAAGISLPPDAPRAIANSVHSRAVLRQNLILLNSGVLVLGVPFCYLLARRTLRPIEAAMENQARFSSDAAHELRTPVAALRARNEVALRNPKLSLPQAKQVIQDSASQAVRLERLSEALLQLSAPTKRSGTTATHLEDAANQAMNLQILSAQAKHITISDEAPNVTVQAGKQDVVQLISILLDNAIKYSPERSSIRIAGERDHEWGVVHVIDEGCGIAPADVPHVFDRFYRADHARADDATSSYGLGLSIAHKIATQNKGALYVQSELGQGSVFTIKLPLAEL